MFAERLKKLRKDAGLTQIELAREFRVANGTVGMWETGKREPDFETARRLADFFGVSVDYLLGGQAGEEPEPERRDSNPDIRMIARAGRKMSPDQAESLRKYAQFMFPEAFTEDGK